MAQPFDLNTILGEIRSTVERINTQTAPAAKATTAETTKIGQEMVDNANAQGEAAATAVRERGALQINLEDELQRIRQAQMPEDLMLENARKMRQSQEAVNQNLQEVQRLNSVGLLDNPLAFVLNALQLPSAQNKLEQAQQTLDVTAANAQKSAQALTASAQAVKSTARTVNNAIIENEAQAKILEGRQAAGRARLEAIRTNTQNLAYELQLDQAQTAELERGRKLLQGEEMFNLQMQNARMQRDMLKRKVEEDQAEDQVVANQVKLVKEQATLMGSKGIAAQLDGVSNLQQLKYLMKQPQMEAMLNAAYLRAGRADGKLMYGTDPIESVEFVQKSGIQLPSRYDPLVAAVRDGITAARSDPSAKAATSKEQKAALYNFHIQQKLDELPQFAPEVVAAATLGSKAPLTDLRLMKAIEFNTNTRAQKDWPGFMEQTAAAIRKGVISPNQAAADLTLIARRSSSYANQQYDQESFGARGLNTFTVPKATIQRTGADGKVVLNSPVDFSNDSDALVWAAGQQAGVLGKLLDAYNSGAATAAKASGLPFGITPVIK